MSDDARSVKRAGQPRGISPDPRRLKRRRMAAGLSQMTAARTVGCSKANLSQLEHGVHGAFPELLARLARAYGCDITDLMPDEPEEKAA